MASCGFLATRFGRCPARAGTGVGLELSRGQRCPVRREYPGADDRIQDHPVLLLRDHVPGDHETPQRSRHCHGRVDLETAVRRRIRARQVVGVDPELQPLRVTHPVKPLSKYVVEEAEILPRRGPNHHEASGVVHRHGRIELVARDFRVDLEDVPIVGHVAP